ncbi:MAG TPA: family 10 glycosylhydrolase, partial [Phycisphaerae bacterium]|nr:family 10 glycosylhydrolase [Phycisphaerae bacterium]
MSHRAAVVSILVSILSAAAASAPPEARKDDFKLVDDFSYSQPEARKTWHPMAGSAPVSVERVAGRRALKLHCTFRPGRIERASWDRKVKLDLTGAKGIQFLFRCRDTSPIGHFTLYLRSGKGWYSGPFYPPGSGQWVPVRIYKRRTGVEGNPAGWGKIDTIRLSAWRGRNVDTDFHIAELGLFGSGGKIVIVRADSAVALSPNEERSVSRCADVMGEFLDLAGLAHTVLSDRDVTPQRLKAMKLAILPYNPRMPDEAADALAGFLKSGGKLIACYTLPRRLEGLVGIRGGRHVPQAYRGYFASIRPSASPLPGTPKIVKQASWNIRQPTTEKGKSRVAAWWWTDKGEPTGKPAVVVSDNCVYLTHILIPDDRPAKQRLLLAMVGHLVPPMWSVAAAGRIDRIGRFEPYDGYAAAERGIRKLASDVKPALAALARAAGLREQALARKAEGKFNDAIATAEEAHQALLDAHCLVQKPAPGEHRAIWCHSAFGVAGMTWEQAVKALADAGFTAVLPNMLWGGVAFYESDVLPVAPEVKEKGDQIALCVAACRKYGVECHVWKVNYNMGWRTPKAFVDRMQSAGRTQELPDGKPSARWLCPSHPDNQKLEIDAMVEVARKYPVHGVHFDYIRYPGRQGCFCTGCRRRFEKAVGRTVKRWPADVRLRGPADLHAKWMDFRREQITAVVAAVALRARKARPGVRISAAVFGNWPADRDAVGQDWKLWCDRGYLDFVCPMDYTPHNRQLRDMVARQLTWAGKVPCYPGIGLSVWPDPTDVAKLIQQVQITRRAKTGGFTIFNYDPAVAR